MDEETAFRLGYEADLDETNPFDPITEPEAYRGWELGWEAMMDIYSEMIHHGG